MDETIIKNWNSKVGSNDLVYVLGDFSMSKDRFKIQRYFNTLKGRKILIKGNHDNKVTLNLNWVNIYDQYEFKYDDNLIVLNHYAMRVWNKSHFNSWHLYGHSHGRLPGVGKSFDIGVDCWNFTPLSYEEVKKEMEKRPNNVNFIHKRDR